MRRRPAPPPSAQQMIREYLGQVSFAATKVLPKGDRLLFVGRTRAAIEATVGPLASADADDVLSALTTLGDPEDLANRERERLYSARRRGAAAAPPALWKPSKESRRGAAPPAPPPARRPRSGQARRPRPWPRRGLTGPDEMQPVGSAPPVPEPAPAVPRQADPRGEEPGSSTARAPAEDAPQQEPSAPVSSTAGMPAADPATAGVPMAAQPETAPPMAARRTPGETAPPGSDPPETAAP